MKKKTNIFRSYLKTKNIFFKYVVNIQQTNKIKIIIY
jgi:hypothetical protein